MTKPLCEQKSGGRKMVSLYDGGIYLVNGKEIVPEKESAKLEALTGKKADKETAKKGTIAYSILSAHNTAHKMHPAPASPSILPLFRQICNMSPELLPGHSYNTVGSQADRRMSQAA